MDKMKLIKENAQPSNDKKTKSEADFFSSLNNMRALACFAVIMIHASIITTPTEWWANNFYGIIPRFAVPFFFMISGALLINKKYNPKTFLKKRLTRVIIPLVTWSVIYYLWKQDDYKSVINFLKQLFTFPIYYHLWFLYSMIGVYLSAIVLIPFYNNSSDFEKGCFLTLWFIVNFIYPTTGGILGEKTNLIDIYNLHDFYGMAGWFFLGAYLRDITPKINYRVTYSIVAACSAAAMLPLTEWDSMRISQGGTLFEVSELFRGLNSPLTLTYSVSLFLLMTKIKSNALANFVANSSLGIYCLHIIALSLTWPLVTKLEISKWVSIPLTSIITLVACTVVISIVRRVSFLRVFA